MFRTILCFGASVRRFACISILGICVTVLSNSTLLAGTTPDGDTTPSDGKSTVDGKSTASDGKAVADGKATAGPAAAEEEPEYKNWINLGMGGLIINGDAAQFKQEHRMSGDVYGGIEDMHLERSLGKATLSIDGRAIFDNDDYNVKVELSQPGLGYIRGGYTEFRSWYDGNGGFVPFNGGTFFSPPYPEMAIDRGEAWVELGLRMPNWPEITIHYSHQFREGQKDSTIWGDTTLTGLPVNSGRKIAPAYRDIDETRDIFSFDALKTFGKTDVDLGMRAEWSSVDNRLQLERGAGQLPPAVAAPGAQRFITQRDQNNVDDFSGHVLTETRFSDTLWFTTGYSYTTLGSDLAGTRITGADYNSVFGEPVPTLQSNDHAILNLAGTSQVNEHVFNSNLFWMPMKDLHALAGFRYTHEETDSESTFLDAASVTTPPPVHYPSPIPKSADTSETSNQFAETLEMRYIGLANWLFYVEGDWEEEFGDVREHEVSGTLVAGLPVSADQGTMNKDTSLLMQKYTAGLNWYPTPKLALSAQYYYKIADYDNDFHSELATPSDFPRVAASERNQRLLWQGWDTNDANVRVTFRPKLPAVLGTISFVTRYDFMQSDVSARWSISPAGPSPTPAPTPPVNSTGTVFDERQTGLITNHVISESVTWNPLPRLYLQATGSYVLSETETPAGTIDLIFTGTTAYKNPTVVNFRNDYWTVTGGAGFILDDKTDLHAEYSFYQASDYLQNVRVALPYGMGATEHTVSASISRQLTKNMRLLLRYGYFHYTDQLSGGHDNYEAHSVYSGLQFRF
jgi:hypothetical protein